MDGTTLSFSLHIPWWVTSWSTYAGLLMLFVTWRFSAYIRRPPHQRKEWDEDTRNDRWFVDEDMWTKNNLPVPEWAKDTRCLIQVTQEFRWKEFSSPFGTHDYDGSYRHYRMFERHWWGYVERPHPYNMV